jgi:hypothetical protein
MKRHIFFVIQVVESREREEDVGQDLYLRKPTTTTRAATTEQSVFG